MARQGYVVFAYDMVGYNDTVQTPHVFGGPREQLWAFGPLGLQLWNSIRAADFLESLPDVDPARLAMTGASGGGTQTFLLTAIDPRIQAAAPVNMVSAIMQGGSPCENAPNLRIGTYNVEIAALAAPRPLLMVSATGDWTRNTPREEFPAVQAIYQLYGKAAEVETQQVDAPHNYNRESREHVYKFFARKVLGASDASGYEEKGYRVEKLQDMLALHGRSLPPGSLTYQQIVAQWIAAAAWQTRTTTDAAQLEERLRVAIGAEWPTSVVHSQQGEAVVLGREGVGDRVPGLWFPGKGEALLAVHPDGASAARNLDRVKEWRAAGRPVLLIDAFQTGSAVAPRNRDTRYFLTFNRSDDANRAQDIVTAMAWLVQQGHQKPRLTGTGRAAVWSTFAAAVAGRPVTLDADLSGFQGEDQDFVEQFFVPGIQRAGGLIGARRVLAAR
jgi:dienelactone hydrolase